MTLSSIVVKFKYIYIYIMIQCEGPIVDFHAESVWKGIQTPFEHELETLSMLREFGWSMCHILTRNLGYRTFLCRKKSKKFSIMFGVKIKVSAPIHNFEDWSLRTVVGLVNLPLKMCSLFFLSPSINAPNKIIVSNKVQSTEKEKKKEQWWARARLSALWAGP